MSSCAARPPPAAGCSSTYGDHEGGQRTIARFGVTASSEEDARRAEVLRYWNVDGENPR